jgi:hypothetical protein
MTSLKIDTFKDNFFTNCFSNLWAYDLHGPVRNAFDAGKSITRASGRGLGPVNGIEPLGECYLGPQIVGISFSVFYMFFHAFQSVEHNGTWSLIQR